MPFITSNKNIHHYIFIIALKMNYFKNATFTYRLKIKTILYKQQQQQQKKNSNTNDRNV